MARNQRPSFLKRQKEQQRLARAQAKRDARRARKANPRVEDESVTDVENPDFETSDLETTDVETSDVETNGEAPDEDSAKG